MDLEKVRRSFRPQKVKVLFIGESIPVGGTFLYLGNSNLARYTQEAFSIAYGVQFESTQMFLDEFKAKGFYLDDLCPIPVNHMNNAERVVIYEESAANFAERLKEIRPEAVITVKRTIEAHISRALIIAGLSNIPNYSLPFPAMGHQMQYVQELSEVIHDLKNRKIIAESL
ncbi:MAG: hypothetical protein WA610_14175 [Thermodesulfovibrionales bacterium]